MGYDSPQPGTFFFPLRTSHCHSTRQRRKVPAAGSRRTWLPEEPPAHTDTAPEPKHRARRSDIHVQRHTLFPGGLSALPPLWPSWWSAGGEWGSSLDPSSPSPPGSSGSWTGPPNTSALARRQAEINKDPQVPGKKKTTLDREHASDAAVNRQKDPVQTSKMTFPTT